MKNGENLNTNLEDRVDLSLRLNGDIDPVEARAMVSL
jgi:hypothetical protein